MKVLLIALILMLLSGCISYHPERFINDPHPFWIDPAHFGKDELACPECGEISTYKRSYSGWIENDYDHVFLYYFKCPNCHLWILIEARYKEDQIILVRRCIKEY